jgi:hypothetical protein
VAVTIPVVLVRVIVGVLVMVTAGVKAEPPLIFLVAYVA